jgi:hypothetical protein
MTRQSRPHRDPTAERALAPLPLEGLTEALATLPEIDREVVVLRFGLHGGDPMTLGQVATVLGVPTLAVWASEARLLSLLRHPSRSMRLRDYIDSDHLPPVPEAVRERTTGATPWSLFRCDRHGWRPVQNNTSARCVACHCPLPTYDGCGRPPQHCSNACRQAAYRRRQGGAGAATAPRTPPDQE